jgi:hypothetical protein
VIAGGRAGDRQVLVVVASVLRSWKWRESCKRDREEEVVLAAVQEEVLSEKCQSAQRGPRRRKGRRRCSGGGAEVL